MPATTLNLAHLLDYQARLTPARPAILCRPVELTFGQLDALATQAAAGLASLGLGPGDHIALSCPNTPHFPVAYYAILKLGAVVVPLNVLLKPREIAFHLRDSDAKAILVFEGTAELPMARMAREACDDVPGCEHVVVLTIDPAGACPIEQAVTLGDLTRHLPPVHPTHPTRPDDTAVILYTSGTTGQPKGAELTHFNMTMNAMVSRDLLSPALDHDPASQTRILITLPLFHSTGQTAQLNAGIAGGWGMVLLPRFDPAAVLRAFETERVNCWVGVPTMYWMLLQHVRQHAIDPARAAASLRVCVSGGAPMPLSVLHEFEQMFGVRVLEGYGLSETAPVACFNQLHRPAKIGTVGLPIPACEVAIVDDADRRLAAGERGEIVIRGHNIMKGYYKRPAETAAALRGGWFHTGDVGLVDDEGYVSIVDRLKDVIIRGGLNVYPREIEEQLLTHPAIALAAVIGIPDERLGEDVKAVIVVKPGVSIAAEEVIAWARERMAGYKYPRVVEFRESLPVGPTGKVVKRGLV